jgi:hypothetical protein
MCAFSKTAFPLHLKVLHDTLARQCQRCSRDCSGVLVVASLGETRGLLSRFDCAYSGYITQGGAGGALVGCYEPTAQVLLHSVFIDTHSSSTGTLCLRHFLRQILPACRYRHGYIAIGLGRQTLPSLHAIHQYCIINRTCGLPPTCCSTHSRGRTEFGVQCTLATQCQHSKFTNFTKPPPPAPGVDRLVHAQCVRHPSGEWMDRGSTVF